MNFVQIQVSLLLCIAVCAGCSSSAVSSPSAEPSVAVDCAQLVSGANLSECDLSGANLAGVDLSSANLTRADLKGADLTGADLSGADLTFADLTGANLAGANLAGVKSGGAKFLDANLTGTTGVPTTVLQELLRPVCAALQEDMDALDSAADTWYDFFFPEGIVIKRDVEALDAAYKGLSDSISVASPLFSMAGYADILEKYSRYVSKEYSLFKSARKSGFEYYSRVNWLEHRNAITNSSYLDAKIAVEMTCS